MKLSIVIPTKNEEKNIGRLLRSIKNQTFTDYEIIVADNASTDKTASIAKEFGARVVKGGLPGPGRNSGAEVAKGELIFFFDADVVLTKTFLDRSLKKFTEDELDCATCLIIPLSEKRVDRFLHRIANVYLKATEKIRPHAPGFCILIKRQLHEKIGGFDETVMFAEDHDYINRASKVGKYQVITDPRIHVSVRRLEKDGRLNIAVKYLLAEAYINFIGEIRSDIFNYKFAHFNEKDDSFRERLKKTFLTIAQSQLPTSKDELSRLYNDVLDSMRGNGKGDH